jgi:hypothetical protein
MRSKKLTVLLFFAEIMILSLLLYLNIYALEIKTSPELNHKLIHKKNGLPCGTAYFKCRGVEKNGVIL